MKRMLLGIAVALATLNGFGQGTVFFYNRTALEISHVWGSPAYYLSLVGPGPNDSPSGTTDYAGAGMVLIGANGTGGVYGGATTFAQLLSANGANQPESSLVPMGQTTTFRTGAAAGNLFPITDILEGVPPDSPAATLEMVAWDNSSGLYPTWTQASVAWRSGVILACGMSGAFTVYAIGGNVNTPPSLPIPSFNLYPTPEPSTFALVGLGAAMLVIARRRK